MDSAGARAEEKALIRTGGENCGLHERKRWFTRFAMPPQEWTVRRLLNLVRSATKSPGAKSELARELKISRQHLHGWLRKEKPNVPTGDNLLRLLEWATAEEAKPKKTPDVLSTRPALKARKKVNRDEKPTPKPRKK